jgi:hypothetical protein
VDSFRYDSDSYEPREKGDRTNQATFHVLKAAINSIQASSKLLCFTSYALLIMKGRDTISFFSRQLFFPFSAHWDVHMAGTQNGGIFHKAVSMNAIFVTGGGVVKQTPRGNWM